MPVIPASDGFAVTAYETWSTEARRGVGAAQASGHDRKFVVALALGSRDRLNLIYIEHCRSSASLMLRLDLGARIPIATTAMGRALLAATPEKERVWLMDHIARREGERWPKVRAGIEQAIKDFTAQGFAISVGDWQPDVRAVGVPLVPADGSGA